MTIKEIEVGGKTFEYDDDRSWNKWKKYVVNWKTTEVEKLDWMMENVVISDTSQISWRMAIELKIALDNKFGLTERKIKKLLKDSGKVSRGLQVKYLSYRAMEYQILIGMGGGIVKNINDMTIHDMFFYKKLLDEKAKDEKEAIKEQERKAQDAARKAKRRR